MGCIGVEPGAGPVDITPLMGLDAVLIGVRGVEPVRAGVGQVGGGRCPGGAGSGAPFEPVSAGVGQVGHLFEHCLLCLRGADVAQPVVAGLNGLFWSLYIFILYSLRRKHGPCGPPPSVRRPWMGRELGRTWAAAHTTLSYMGG